MAICAAGLEVTLSIKDTNGVTIHNMVKITVPITLNIRCINVVRFAFRLVPMDAKTAVIHVPIFCPNNTYTAPSSPINPLTASACKIPTDADDDCIMAVNTAPASIPNTGLENVVIR